MAQPRHAHILLEDALAEGHHPPADVTPAAALDDMRLGVVRELMGQHHGHLRLGAQPGHQAGRHENMPAARGEGIGVGIFDQIDAVDEAGRPRIGGRQAADHAGEIRLHRAVAAALRAGQRLLGEFGADFDLVVERIIEGLAGLAWLIGNIHRAESGRCRPCRNFAFKPIEQPGILTTNRQNAEHCHNGTAPNHNELHVPAKPAPGLVFSAAIPGGMLSGFSFASQGEMRLSAPRLWETIEI